ncbi:MAG: DUF4956 domain-containing protein [Ruminococcaceae bacterium]|nr:DUF4956 domain-containing protein [Oscillospiraceae bacterium]
MLSSIISTEITISVFLICTGISLVLGIGTALVYSFKNRCTQSFAVTLAMLPAIVQIVIMLVNGNIGAGVAVAGAFSLVRFRSAPGTAKEIGAIFMAMAIGLATGMGYVALAGIFFAILSVFIIVLTVTDFGSGNSSARTLKITIPENLDYDGLFDDLFEQYTKHASLEKVKTTNMGTMFELQYEIILKQPQIPKALIDEIRCRNGNLNIVCSKVDSKEAL